MHPLYWAPQGPFVPVLVTFVVLVAYRYTYGSPRCRISFIFLSLSLFVDGVELAGFKSMPNGIYWPKLQIPFSSSNFSFFLCFFRWVYIVGLVSSD